MSDIDSVIESLRANADALKETASIAEAAHLPEEDRLAIERARETLQAIMEKAYDLAMERGLDRNIPRARSSLSRKEIRPSTMIVPQPKRFRTVEAPPAVGEGVVNRFTTVVVADDEDVELLWTHTPEGARFVSGYTIIRRAREPDPERPFVDPDPPSDS
jgi:hypothetical protein